MKFKTVFIPFILLIVVLLGINSQANTSPDSPYDYLSNTSNTLLDSNLFTHVDDTSPYQQDDVDMSDFTKTLENDELILYVNDENFAIRIENKTTGFIWASDYVGDTEGIRITGAVKRRMESAFSFTYLELEKNRTAEKAMLHSELELNKTVDTENQIITFNVDLTTFEIKLAYTLTLVNNTVEFNLEQDTIEEYGNNRLLNITFYEFLGAAPLHKIPGYHFIPSGNGALIRYTENTPINSEYRARFYGQDLYYPISDNNYTLNYPIYGSVHGINQNAVFINITNGAENGEYHYTPPEKMNPFHEQFTRFYFREAYIQAIPGADSKVIYEKNLKDYNIGFNMTFLANDDANYVGMAKSYKDYLVENGYLTRSSFNDHIGVHLDILGSDYEEGIFFKKKHEMTTTDDILEINKELMKNDVNHILYSLRGFNKGGYTDSDYDTYKFNNSLGDIDDLEDLNVSIYYNPVVKYLSKDNVPRNTLIKISNQYAKKPIMDQAYYEYVMDIQAIIKEFSDAYKTLDSYGGMSLDGLSNTFYSNENYNRKEMYQKYRNLLDEKISMFNPNQIMLVNTSVFLNAPLQHERLKFLTDNVPFIQILLSGYLPYYSTYLNFSANMKLDLLKLVDFGSYPAYLITKQPSHLLTNTLSREFYGSYYGNLKGYIIDQYQYINTALTNVIGEEIISRTVVDKGIVVVKYANDVELIINYSSSDYIYEGQIVKAMDYAERRII